MAHTSFYLKIIVSTQEKAFPRMKTSQTLKNVLKFMKLSMSMTTTECTNLSVF